MYSLPQRALAYLRYRWRSIDRYGVHSPFLYDLIEHVFRGPSQGIPTIEAIRTEFLKDRTPLQNEDLGAGSVSGSKTKRVCDLARYSLSTRSQCAILHRLIEHMQLDHVIEFGSSLGVSSAYMAHAGAQVISMEGSPSIHNIAKRSFDHMPIDFRLGAFEKILPGILEQIPRLDLAYVDGDHRYAPTVSHFEQLLPYVHDDSVIIFDDIHWSQEMENAWEQIQGHDRVTLSVDLFWCGMVFFKQGLSGQRFTIRY